MLYNISIQHNIIFMEVRGMIDWINDVFFYEDKKKQSGRGNTFTAVTITVIIFMIIISLLQHHYNNKIEQYESIIAQYNNSEHTEVFPENSSEPRRLATPPQNTMLYLSLTDLSNDDNPITCDSCYWIGDSRTVGLADYCAIDYIAEVGCGLDYFVDNIDVINNLRGYNVIINLGVNDLYNVDKYIDVLNNLSDEFFAYNNLYYLSVNPCENDYKYLNTDINNFNNKLLTQLREDYTFLDCNSYLKANGFETVDGLHYTENTYRDIYNFVKDSINN